MKNILFFFACLSFLSACQSGGAGKVTLEGTIKGFGDGEIYMIKPSDNPVMDTVKVLKDKFTKEIMLTEPTVYMLSFGQDQQPGFIVLEPGKASLTYTMNEVSSLKATSGKEQEVLEAFNQLASPYYKKMDSLGMIAMSAPDDTASLFALQSQFEKFNEELNGVQRQFIKDHPSGYASSFIALSFLSEKQDRTYSDIIGMYNGLDKKVQASYFGLKLKEMADQAKKTAEGEKAPGFTLPDVDGNLVSLTQFKGQYLLIDFWASWCRPCRDENPNVVNAYQEFHAKGFDILGVSLDEDKSKWLDAIAKDGLTWTHVSDLKGWKSDVAALYSIQSIPSNVLIDKDGKVIAKNLRGPALLDKLESLMP